MTLKKDCQEEKCGKSTVFHYFMQGDRLRHRELCRSSSGFSQISGTSETISGFSETHQRKEQKEVIITFIILWNMLEMKIVTAAVSFSNDRTNWAFLKSSKYDPCEDGTSL